jgi:hypothetical protein
VCHSLAVRHEAVGAVVLGFWDLTAHTGRPEFSFAVKSIAGCEKFVHSPHRAFSA